MKTCPACKTEKSLTEFYKNKNRKDGHTVYCKKCVGQQQKEFNNRPENIERVRNRKRKYAQEHKQEALEYSRWYRNTPKGKEVAKTTWRNYVVNHPEMLVRKKERDWKRRGGRLSSGEPFKQKDFDDLLSKQNNRCGICGNEFLKDDKISVDHDHKTGIVRGLLCHACNVGLGLFRDEIERLKKAIDYLKRSSILN